MVSTTDATRSWHGTSVQCMQPMPQSSSLSSEEVVSTTQLPAGKHFRSSPVASPAPVVRSKHRCRTLTEQPSPHTKITIPRPQQDLSQEDLDHIDLEDYPSLARVQLSLQHFRVSATEQNHLQHLKVDMFKSILLKHCEAERRCSILPGLSSLISCIQTHPTDKEVSNVVYVEIRSERADCKATLTMVHAKLYRTFIADFGQKWLIAVGDAKTFDLLQTIRSEYGSHVKWLLPFPGDWPLQLPKSSNEGICGCRTDTPAGTERKLLHP